MRDVIAVDSCPRAHETVCKSTPDASASVPNEWRRSWNRTGAQPPAEPDHLATLLGAYASLIEAEGAAEGSSRDAWRHARRAFLFEHLASWLPPYLRKLGEIAPTPYAHWGRLLLAAVEESLHDLKPPETAPSHFRELGSLADPRVDGMAEFFASLRAPRASWTSGCAMVSVAMCSRRPSRKIHTACWIG